MEHGSVQHLLSQNLPADHQDAAEGQESIKAKLNAVRNKLVRQVSGNDPSEAPRADVHAPYWGGDDAFVDTSHRWIFPTGSLSHRAARGPRHHHQLSADAGREIYNFLPPQL